jgi:hypothetical protein
MFDHLLEFPVEEDDAVALDDATVPQLLSAQATTVSWLESLGAHVEDASTPTAAEAAAQAARTAFCSITDPYQDPLKAKSALLAMHAPPAVRQLAGMLSQYDWAFVRQAQEIRGYIVARLLEHAASPDAKVSLSALGKLGTVTEVSAFTTRLEIDHRQKDTTPDAVISRLRERLQSLMPAINAAAGGVEDAVIVDGPQ